MKTHAYYIYPIKKLKKIAKSLKNPMNKKWKLKQHRGGEESKAR